MYFVRSVCVVLFFAVLVALEPTLSGPQRVKVDLSSTRCLHELTQPLGSGSGRRSSSAGRLCESLNVPRTVGAISRMKMLPEPLPGWLSDGAWHLTCEQPQK